MQDLKFEGEELNQYIPMSCLKTDKTFEKCVPVVDLMHFVCFATDSIWANYRRHSPPSLIHLKDQVCGNHD